MRLAESVLSKFEESKKATNEEVSVAKIIKDLQATDFSGSNEEQLKAVQLLKGLATSEDPMSNEFMKELAKHVKMIEVGKIEEGDVEEKLSDVPASLRKEAAQAKTILDNLNKRRISLEAAIRREDDKEKLKEIDDTIKQVMLDIKKQERVHKQLKSKIASIAKR